MIDITDEQLGMVCKILEKHIPGKTVVAFGSRINSHSQKASDLDLAIINEEALSLTKLAELREAFSESDLSFRVDLVDVGRVGGEFRKKIMDQYEIVYNPGRLNITKWLKNLK